MKFANTIRPLPNPKDHDAIKAIAEELAAKYAAYLRS